MGCEGFGSIGAVPHPFSGNWLGAWEDRGRPDTGSIDWDIALDGTLTGSMSRTTSTDDGDITGTVSRTGEFSGTVDYAANDFTVTGTMTKTDTTVTILFTYTYLGNTYTGSATLTRGS